MKLLALAGSVATLATLAAYTSTHTNSEASLLIMWGAALLAMARVARRRQTVTAVSSRPSSEVRTSGISLEAGV